MSSKKQHRQGKLKNKRQKAEKSKTKNRVLLALVGLLVLVFGLGIKGFWAGQKGVNQHTSKTQSTKHPVVVGQADACAKNPAFPLKYGLHPPYFIDLRQLDEPGLRIIEAKKGGKVLQLDSWKKEGTLGPYTLDKNGVIYTAPIPFVNLLGRPPLSYNRILKVDAATGEMSELMHLPHAQKPTEEQPYGVVGMTYDCSNHSLYVSSLAGSTGESEVGRIYHIDLKSKKILHQLDGFDALGLGVFTMKSGKKLYMGSARSPEIFSIDLDDDGGFVGQPVFEFSLAALEGGSYDNAHRIRFLRGNVLKIKGIEFSFSLMAASDPQRNIYLFDYDDQGDKWVFREAHPQ